MVVKSVWWWVWLWVGGPTLSLVFEALSNHFRTTFKLLSNHFPLPDNFHCCFLPHLFHLVLPPHSSADIQISTEGGRERLDELIQQVETLINVTPKSEADMVELPWDYCGGNFTRTLHDWDTRTTEKDSAGGVYLAAGMS